MKVNLIANISHNGQVLLAGKSNHNVPQEALGYFFQLTNNIKSLVLGSATFKVLESFGGAEQVFPGVEIVVLSAGNFSSDKYKVARTPEEALSYLSEKGFTATVLGGGTKTYNAFLEAGLVTDIFFNLIPVIVGDGGVIGDKDNFVTRFKIVENKMLTEEILQVQYAAV
ncbi:Dihydrofolate reductase [Chitinophaga jiangningensis]|uniref:Dihydrofolate reductase n=1 Tax=Chitinophaga jiangningensis TaxID=1419482 RepID=A0A1M7KIW2_9BACT|nr:dihydrofolate reductase family protein [Chitinophaga jiangningensis]SHM64831.1 Dihydrofolate reductase [Chitinophaga jiangningensis]